MTKEYPNGDAFLAENTDFLNQNPSFSGLFFVDAKALVASDAKNYAARTDADGKTLLAIRVEPYNLLLYGAKECLGEMLRFLSGKQCDIDGVLCLTDVGERLIQIAPAIIQKQYSRVVGMDFMETAAVTEASAPGITVPTQDDLEELFENTVRFFQDCGLPDRPERETLLKKIPNFRVLKRDGKIVSMASFYPNNDSSDRIAYVYTRPEYRGKGYARQVVNSLKNEILARGKIATLNVDQANPVSNHLYQSLGFKKVFSQGIYTAVQ